MAWADLALTGGRSGGGRLKYISVGTFHGLLVGVDVLLHCWGLPR